VLVADGTYVGDGNRDIDFLGKAIVVMSENGPEVTIIDCQGAGRGFLFHSGEDTTSVIQRFTIQNGYASGTNPHNSGSGGAIFCDNSSPTILNCILWGDSPKELYIYPSSSVLVTYSTI